MAMISSLTTPDCVVCIQTALSLSQAAGSDGKGVRIRCGCGGKHADHTPRMHANWKRVESENSSKTMMAKIVTRQITNPMFRQITNPMLQSVGTYDHQS